MRLNTKHTCDSRVSTSTANVPCTASWKCRMYTEGRGRRSSRCQRTGSWTRPEVSAEIEGWCKTPNQNKNRGILFQRTIECKIQILRFLYDVKCADILTEKNVLCSSTIFNWDILIYIIFISYWIKLFRFLDTLSPHFVACKLKIDL